MSDSAKASPGRFCCTAGVGQVKEKGGGILRRKIPTSSKTPAVSSQGCQFSVGELPPPLKPATSPSYPTQTPATTQNPFEDPIGPPLASISDSTSDRWVHDVKQAKFKRICAVIPTVFRGICAVLASQPGIPQGSLRRRMGSRKVYLKNLLFLQLPTDNHHDGLSEGRSFTEHFAIWKNSLIQSIAIKIFQSGRSSYLKEEKKPLGFFAIAITFAI